MTRVLATSRNFPEPVKINEPIDRLFWYRVA